MQTVTFPATQGVFKEQLRMNNAYYTDSDYLCNFDMILNHLMHSTIIIISIMRHTQYLSVMTEVENHTT